MTATIEKSSALTATCINPVLTATRQVFETMLNCTPTRRGLALKESGVPGFELSAVVGITGKASGTIVLSLSLETALETLNRMVGIQASEITAEVCDAVGELTNMIAGAAKAQLEELALSISIPNIVSGRNHEVHYPSNVSPICIMYDSDIGPFAIEVGLSELHS